MCAHICLKSRTPLQFIEVQYLRESEPKYGDILAK
jgi:hypothetical protein